MLELADDRGARVSGSEQLSRDDVEVWGMEAEEGRQLVLTSAELGRVFAGPVRHRGACVAHVTWGHRDGAQSGAR